MRLRAALLSILVVCSVQAFAAAPGEQLADPAKEARARSLGHELRCLVCQNQSIDESDAALARDLRLLVRERITAGDSDDQIRDFLVARYGEFILLNPRLSVQTILLWGLPVLALLFGGFAARALFRRREDEVAEPQAAALSTDEAAALDAILAERASKSSEKP